jgi:tRNA threonylcarbamoyladenosine biosynthesis protein TsaB
MRYILGIDTAGLEASTALAADGKVVSEESLPPGGHSAGLAAAIARVLDARGLEIGDLSAIAVSKGPGSFTGLRIGLAWAKGAASARGVPLVLVSAHEVAAHHHRGTGSSIVTMIPGERGHVEAALWQMGPEGRAELRWGPVAVSEEVALDDLVERAVGRPLVVAPATSKLMLFLREELEDRLEREADAVSIAAPAPFGAAVAELGDRDFLAGRREDVVSASPSYGRAPNARKPAG